MSRRTRRDDTLVTLALWALSPHRPTSWCNATDIGRVTELPDRRAQAALNRLVAAGSVECTLGTRCGRDGMETYVVYRAVSHHNRPAAVATEQAS